jgi:hypothetical protein
MSDPTAASEWAKAVPVIVGGSLAILGGIIGQIIANALSRSRDRASLRRERAEALVRSLYAHTQWIKDKQSALFRQQDHDEPSPLSEAQMLQKLYFPTLAPQLLAILKAELPLFKFVGAQRLAQVKDLTAWIAAWDATPFNDAYVEYLKAIEAAVAKCREEVVRAIGG